MKIKVIQPFNDKENDLAFRDIGTVLEVTEQRGQFLIRKDYWRISDSHILYKTLTNKYLASVGYDDILQRYKVLHLNY
ncbi:MAG: hypothetical protein MJ089_00015 [Ruminococcus sp.]|nr:hypothetical protein [Ruminococcus sp.]